MEDPAKRVSTPLLSSFSTAFAAEIARRADAESMRGVIHSDGELSGEELCADLARVLRAAGPWGQGFPEPVFDGRFEILDSRVVGGRHLKMALRRAGADFPADGLDAIAFGYVGGPSEDAGLRAGMAVHVAYRLEVNEFRGEERVQLNCQHMQRA